MRSALPCLLAASLFLASPAFASVPEFVPDAPVPLPGLSEYADQSIWCATMATHLAQNALESGDVVTYQALAPIALALSRQVSTFFVAAHFGQPDVKSYLDLYKAEIVAVLAGTSPERYAPQQCKGIVMAEIRA